MKCNTSTCTARGKRANDGWCDDCYGELTCGFDRNRRDAERLAGLTGLHWVVAELTPSARTAVRARKLGKKAYGAYREADRGPLERAGYKVVEEYGPEGRVWQSPEAP